MMEILMATYNGAAFLREQIDSILAQTDGGWHLTVSDDGSEDETADIIDSYAERYPDKITRYRSGKRFGNARDHFLHLMKEACTAEWMLLCDQDDVWFPNKAGSIRKAIREAEAKYGADKPLLIFSDQVPADGNLKPLADSLVRYQKLYTDSFDYRSILIQNAVTGGAMAVNRPLVKLAGESRKNSSMIMHDWWMAAVAARFGRIVYIPEPLGYYRQHGGNAVGARHHGSIGYIRNRIGALKDVRETIVKKKTQAVLFRTTYKERLNDSDRKFLSGFTRRRSGIFFYLKYRKLLHGFERKLGMMILG
ncbi:MAG: glycosyltransferase family 2 protein [Lachnospiraceae bacterium]|nr:glycosyltransferase family 2 protein [Lachnospiraceae bacterium]